MYSAKEQLEMEKAHWEIKTAKMKYKTYWWLFAISIAGGLISVVTFVKQFFF